MKAVFFYAWGEKGISEEDFTAARSTLGIDTAVIAGNLLKAGLRESVENCPPGLDIILQPSPLTATTNSKDEQGKPRWSEPGGVKRKACLAELEDLFLDYPDIQAVIIAHESGIRAEGVEHYLPVFAEFCERHGVEPILLLDSPEYEKGKLPWLAGLIEKCSVWAEVKHALWNAKSNPPRWYWGDTEAGVREHLRERIAMVRRTPQRPYDGLCLQLGGQSDFDYQHWGRPVPTPEQIRWLCAEDWHGLGAAIWLWDTQGIQVGLDQGPGLCPILKNKWHGGHGMAVWNISVSDRGSSIHVKAVRGDKRGKRTYVVSVTRQKGQTPEQTKAAIVSRIKAEVQAQADGEAAVAGWSDEIRTALEAST